MASVLDIDIPFVVKFRFHAVIVAGKSCLCENKIELCQNRKIREDRVGVRHKLAGKSCQNELNFPFFLDFQLAQFVVQLDDRERLDKYSRTGRGLVVHHAWNLGFILSLDRQAVAPVAHCDDGIL